MPPRKWQRLRNLRSKIQYPGFWFQDRFGWRVVEWSGCGRRRCRSCPRHPVAREPRSWNWYGRRLVARYEELQQ